MKPEFERLNRLLASELGRIPNGSEGLYQWEWSELLYHPARAIDPKTGALLFDYRCGCGLNVRVHSAACLLTVPEPKWIIRRMCPQLKEQWVVLVWCDPGTQDQWEKEFGGRLQYPAQGYRVPTNVCLGYGEEPDRAVTWDLIHKIRKQRKKTMGEWVQECEDALDLQERRKESELDAMIGDACTAFGNAKPGARMGGISFPSKQTSATGKEHGRLVTP